MALLITKLFGILSNWKMPKSLLRKVIDRFSESFHIQTDEFDLDEKKIRTFQDFFTREFKPGARTFNGEIASPAEGLVSACGLIENSTLMQVKDVDYPLHELVLDPGFTKGCYLTIYLQLGDYHHVHMPLDGTLLASRAVKGAYYSTNLDALKRRKNVYLKNERLIWKGTSAYGNFYLVMVGATCVGKIEPSDGLKQMAAPVDVDQGEMLGTFHMGSTVVLVFEDPNVLSMNWSVNDRIKLGQAIFAE